MSVGAYCAPMLRLALLSMVALLATAGSASAATYTVDSLADLHDQTLDGVCADTNTDCTLRAAIEESNNSSGTTDTINFSSSFDGTAANGTITLVGDLPPITDPVTIDGGHCSLSTDSEPCAGIKGTGTRAVSGIGVSSGVPGTVIKNLAFSNLATALQIGGTNTTITGNWFGINLDEGTTNAANGQGLFLTTSGGSNTVGGTTPATRNLFAQNGVSGVGAAVTIFGSDSNTVSGNYFGTNRAGASPTAGFVNNDGILVAGIAPSDQATGNIIGGADTNSNTACDGACNLIGNYVDDGIDLGNQFNAALLPASTTTILGNYIGLALNGTDGNNAGSSSGHNGIDFGGGTGGVASGITIGGASASARNYIGGNPTGIDTGITPGASSIQNNYLGVQPDGTGAVSNGFDTLDVSASPSGSVQVLNNLIGGNGAAGLEGIYAYGRNTTIRGNQIGVDTAGTVIGFGGPAIQTQGSTVDLTIGGTGAGQGNVIAGGGTGGIRLNDAFRVTVQGNFIGTDSAGTATYGNTGPGILADGTHTQPNTIGGTTAAGENLISNNTGDAIRISQTNGVEVQRNRGIANGEQFIDLETPSGPGNDVSGGSANGLQAPVITTFDSLTQASGTSNPGATVQLFAKSSASAGELGSELGTATADGSGTWTVTFSSQPEGTRVTALQTVFHTGSGVPSANESSELSPVVQLDTTTPDAPSITATSPVSPGNDDTPAVIGTAEAGSTVKLYSGANCNGSVLASGTAAQFAGSGLSPTSAIPPDALTTFRATATDAAGHTSNCSNGFGYTEDSTAPDLSIDSTPAALSNDSTPTVTFHGSDTNGVSFQCSFTGPSSGSANPCSSPYDFGGSLGDGDYTAHVTAVDGAQNQTQSSDIDFTIDATPPVTVIDSAPSGTTSDNTPTVTFHANDATVATFTCKVDSGSAAACSSPATFGPLSDGPHTIAVKATDAVGNVELTPQTASFTVNTIQPVVPLAPAPPTAPATKKKCKKKKHRAASVAKKKKCKKKRR
jgi:hypothetical protein